ncbi:hypothetical protein [Cellulomonas hominis]|uniref:hypothetical protein n=1 Tax=Cellulomonas hominis TaxID=156981 RepID=UPI001B9A26B3|nr:hypothetical protein [Cellulomonas hominis]VTR75665.1 hypothetical protein CHMI_00416 [Cellulomonas hominis]
MTSTAWVVLLAPTVALLVGIGAIVQRDRADRRAEWWRRAQWSLDHVMAGTPAQRAVGLALTDALSSSALAGFEEVDVLARFAVARLDDMTEDGATEDGSTEDGSTADGSTAVPPAGDEPEVAR